jgi:hypothetical protein
MDPGSAAHHAAKSGALRSVRGTLICKLARGKKKARIKRAFE